MFGFLCSGSVILMNRRLNNNSLSGAIPLSLARASKLAFLWVCPFCCIPPFCVSLLFSHYLKNEKFGIWTVFLEVKLFWFRAALWFKVLNMCFFFILPGICLTTISVDLSPSFLLEHSSMVSLLNCSFFFFGWWVKPQPESVYWVMREKKENILIPALWP